MDKRSKLAIYYRNLKRYEAAGDTEKARIQRQLIKRIKLQKGKKK